MTTTGDSSAATLAQETLRLTPGLDPAAVWELLGQADEDYRSRATPEQVARHARLLAGLDPGHPACVDVLPAGGASYEVTVAAFDFFGEFSFLCGLLASRGLDIDSGHVHTLVPGSSSVPARALRRPRGRPRPASPSRRILDVFRVRPRGTSPPTAADLERELLALLGLVSDGRPEEARERLNRQLVEALTRAPARFSGAMHPLEITFDNTRHPQWTVMRVVGRDAPGFLYALAGALALRGIYVQRVRIETEGDLVRDEFLIGHREGGAIGETEQGTLRLAVALIKQFTHFLPWAPDPARALRYFDQLVDRAMAEGPDGPGLSLFRSREGLRELARLLGSSEFLWEDFLRTQFEHLRPLLGEWRSRPLRDRPSLLRELREQVADASSPEERKQRLNAFKDENMLLADMRRLLDPSFTLEAFSSALADLAEAVAEETLVLARQDALSVHGRPLRADGSEAPFAAFALGKFGGREMGYASDVELLFAYDGPGTAERTGADAGVFFEDVVRRFTDLITAREDGFFHVDLRLRPHGRKGPLASPLALLREYYRPGGEAHPFERQALVKLRRAAGDEALGRAVERLRDAYVWSGEPFPLEEALRLRDRQVHELVPPGRFNVKLSPGALVEVEYAVQYLQIEHGRDRPELHTPSTLAALDGLAHARLLSADEHRDLREAYLFWRVVADGLRMVRGTAHDLLLPETGSVELRLLARRLGYPGADWREAAERLSADVQSHRQRVATFFARRFRA
jgi:glutamate-ammonia-ligase adenylyltransferase